MKSFVGLLLIVLLAEQSFATSSGVTKEEYGKHVPGEQLLGEKIVKVPPKPNTKNEIELKIALPRGGRISILELFHSNNPEYTGTEYGVSQTTSETEETYLITLRSAAGKGIDTKVLIYGTFPKQQGNSGVTKEEYGQHVLGEQLLGEKIVKVPPKPNTKNEMELKIALPRGGRISILELFHSNNPEYTGTEYGVSQTTSETEETYLITLRSAAGKGIDTKVLIYGTFPKQQGNSGVTKEEYGQHVLGEQLLGEKIVKVPPKPNTKNEMELKIALPRGGRISILELFHSNNPEYTGTEYGVSQTTSETEETYLITLRSAAGKGIDTKVLIYGTFPKQQENSGVTKEEYGQHVLGEQLLGEKIVKVPPKPNTKNEMELKIALPRGGRISILELFHSNDPEYTGTEYGVSQTTSETEETYLITLRSAAGKGIDTKVLIYGTFPKLQGK